MTTKQRKSFRTLASDLKARRQRKLTKEQIDRLNKVFDEIEKEQSKETPKRKIARQPEVQLGRVIPFSDLKKYLSNLKKANAPKGTILDTNVLISSSYEPSPDSEEVSKILDILGDEDHRLFATVNTRSEYLEFQRRLILTEGLFDSIDEFSELRIAGLQAAV